MPGFAAVAVSSVASDAEPVDELLPDGDDPEPEAEPEVPPLEELLDDLPEDELADCGFKA